MTAMRSTLMLLIGTFLLSALTGRSGCGCGAFTVPVSTTAHSTALQAHNEADAPTQRRRDVLRQIVAAAGAAFVAPSPAEAKKEPPVPTPEAVAKAFGAVRFELSDPEGGVAYMQQRIDAEDFVGLLEFTRTYDLEMRKIRMGIAKQFFADKEVKTKATEYANGVTFDLIGINRSSRVGQENVASANKYLQELREDVAKFLSLEEKIVLVEPQPE